MDEQILEFLPAMEQAIEQFNQVLIELRPIWEAIREAILELANAFLEYIVRLHERLRRWWFYVKLLRWHCPHRVAKFIAGRWPKRWLPALPV